jgi:cell division protein ZapA (FtsZ GTPase activity inhibitor)
MSATVKVHLMGRDYLLRSQGNPDLVKEAAVLVEEKLADLPQTLSVDTRDRYILALLNLAGDFLQEKRKNYAVELECRELKAFCQGGSEQTKKMEAALIERIENALDR